MGPLALRAFQYCVANPHLPMVRETMQGLVSAQHFLISESVQDVAEAVVNETRVGIPLAEIEVDLRLPAPVVVLEAPHLSILVAQTEPPAGATTDWVTVMLLSKWDGVSSPHLSYIMVPARGPLTQYYAPQDGLSEERLWGHVLWADAVLSIINTPRLVKRGRPSHKHMERAKFRLSHSLRPEVWEQVTWTVSNPVTAKEQDSDAEHRLPLHFSRAHWRRSEEGRGTAELRHDVPGWWIWVSHSWKGHPDFGIKLHRYSPRLNDADRGYRPKTPINRAVSHTVAIEAAAAATRQGGQS